MIFRFSVGEISNNFPNFLGLPRCEFCRFFMSRGRRAVWLCRERVPGMRQTRQGVFQYRSRTIRRLKGSPRLPQGQISKTVTQNSWFVYTYFEKGCSYNCDQTNEIYRSAGWELSWIGAQKIPAAQKCLEFGHNTEFSKNRDSGLKKSLTVLLAILSRLRESHPKDLFQPNSSGCLADVALMNAR